MIFKASISKPESVSSKIDKFESNLNSLRPKNKNISSLSNKIEKLNLAYGTVTADTGDGYDDFHYYPFVEIKKKGSAVLFCL